MPQIFQSLVDALKGNQNPKDIAKKFNEVAKDRKQQLALDDALKTCTGRSLDPDGFWTCMSIEYQNNMNKPSRIETPLTPTATE